MKRLYLDNAATTIPSDASINELNRVLREIPGNPSSSHKLGLEAKNTLRNARELVSGALSVPSKHIFFTSGATESNNIVLQSLIGEHKKGRIIITDGEHPSIKSSESILKKCGFEVVRAKAKHGITTREDIEKLLTPDTVLVSVIFVNNVLGTKNDIEGISASVKAYSKEASRPILFHTDAVQAIGKCELNLSLLKNVDALSLSGHKFNAPRGCGILYTKSPLVRSLSKAGGQEEGVRGGTENLAAISATALALKEAVSNLEAKLSGMRELKSRFLELLKELLPKARILSSTVDEESVPNIISISLPGLPGEVALRALSEENIYVGTTSACSANAKKDEKNSLTLMGFDPKEAASALRISPSYDTSLEDITYLAHTIRKIYNIYQ